MKTRIKKVKITNDDKIHITPHKASDSYSDTPADPMQLLTDECVNALYVLSNECDLYIGGERAQGQLFKVS